MQRNQKTNISFAFLVLNSRYKTFILHQKAVTIKLLPFAFYNQQKQAIDFIAYKVIIK